MNKRKIVNLIMFLVALIAVILSVYFYYKLRTLKIDTQSANKKEIISLMSKVSDLYLLPTEEKPTIATVSDPGILKEQSFFTHSEKGDKVLIYIKAGKAILYRPSIDKIVDVSSISSNLK